MNEWAGMKFCDAVREAENKIKWRDKRVATPVAPFRAEKRSAQASAHSLSQAQGGLFCVFTVFVCCWSSQ